MPDSLENLTTLRHRLQESYNAAVEKLCLVESVQRACAHIPCTKQLL